MVECVQVYTKQGCPYTQGLIRKLEHNGLPYIRYDVLKDPG